MPPPPPPPPIVLSLDSTGKQILSGPLALPAGIPDAPSISLGGIQQGFILSSAVIPPGWVWIGPGSRHCVLFSVYGLKLATDCAFEWSTQHAIADTQSTSLSLRRDADNRLAQRNGTAPQAHALYNTFSDPNNELSGLSSFERFDLEWVGNECHLWTSKGPAGGLGRDLVLGADATEVIRMATGQKLGFFGAAPVAQPVLGPQTAGGTYGATEQTMLQTVYDALRALGLGT